MTTHNADPRWEELERLRREVAELRDVEERLQQEIAERQRLETAVAAGETRIRRMFENAPVGIALVDLDERIIEVNQALCDILGYDKETLLTKTVPEITHPDDIAVEAKYKADSKEGQFDNFMLEKRYIHADGRIIWGRLSVSTITDDGGSPLYFIGQMEDITRRKKAEEALLTSETRFRMLVEQSPFSIIIYDRNGRILMANLASKQLWRLSPEHFDNLAANYSILEDEVLAQSGLLQQIKQAFAGKAATIPPTVMTLQDYPYEEAATQKLWIAAYAYPVKDEMGHVQEVVVMHEDVTERVLAEEALRQSQEQFELFFTQSIDGCFFMMLDEPLRWDGNTDKESALDYAFGHQRISKINQAMLDQYGAEAAAFIGLTPADFYAHDIPYGRKSWCELFDNGRIRLETNERKQDGTPMWVEGEYVCLYDEDGRIIGHFGIQRDITTRRQMEQALWESEGHFRSLMESAQEFVLYRLRIEPLSPQQAAVVFVSLSITDILGVSDPYDFSTWFNNIHPDDLPRIVAAQQRSVAEGVVFNQEMRIYHPVRAEWRWIRAISHPVFNNAGEQVFFNGLMLDLTERRRVEEALRQSELLHRALVQTIPYGVQEVDIDGRITFANTAMCRTLGYTDNELIGRHIWEMLPDETAQEKLRKMIRYIHKNHPQPETYIVTAQTKDGRLIQTQTDWDYRRDADGTITGTIAIITDISARKRAEERLQNYNQRLQIVQEVAQAILAAQSPEAIANAALMRIQQAIPFSRSSLVLFDFAANEGFILASLDQRPTNILAGMRRPLPEFDIEGQLFAGEPVIRNQLSDTFPDLVKRLQEEGIHTYLAIPLMVQGQLMGALYMAARELVIYSDHYVETLREISGFLAIAIQQARLLEQVQKHAIELEGRVAERTRDLTEANERLLELDRLKTKFISDITHELRTPVTNMLLYLDLIRFGKPESVDRYQAVLHEQVERLRQLVVDSLDLSRLDFPREHVQLAQIDMTPVIDQAVVSLAESAAEKGLGLSFSPETGLPQVRGDAGKLARVVESLLLNALNFTPAGEVQVRTLAHETADFAGFQVEDTGIGFTEEDLQHCFEPFYRGERVGQRNIPGNGLGLALVKRIVDLHNGRIEIESILDQGSTFTIWLPVASQPEPK